MAAINNQSPISPPQEPSVLGKRSAEVANANEVPTEVEIDRIKKTFDKKTSIIVNNTIFDAYVAYQVAEFFTNGVMFEYSMRGAYIKRVSQCIKNGDDIVLVNIPISAKFVQQVRKRSATCKIVAIYNGWVTENNNAAELAALNDPNVVAFTDRTRSMSQMLFDFLELDVPMPMIVRYLTDWVSEDFALENSRAISSYFATHRVQMSKKDLMSTKPPSDYMVTMGRRKTTETVRVVEEYVLKNPTIVTIKVNGEPHEALLVLNVPEGLRMETLRRGCERSPSKLIFTASYSLSTSSWHVAYARAADGTVDATGFASSVGTGHALGPKPHCGGFSVNDLDSVFMRPGVN